MNQTPRKPRGFEISFFWPPRKPRENPADMNLEIFNMFDPRENPADLNLEIFEMSDPRENPADINLETFEKSDPR